MIKIRQIVTDVLAEKKRWAAEHALINESMIYPFSHKLRNAIAARIVETHMEKVSELHKPTYNYDSELKTDRLRIGYLSSDFGSHLNQYDTMDINEK